MNLGLDSAQSELVGAVRGTCAAAGSAASVQDVLKAAGVKQQLSLLDCCLVLEELGASDCDFSMATSLLNMAEHHPSPERIADREQLARCAYSVGIGRRCLELAQERAAERTIGSRKLIEYQSTSHRLAWSVIDLSLARIGVWAAAVDEDDGRSAGYRAPVAAGACSAAVLDCAHSAVQVYGAAGTSEPNMVRLYHAAYAIAGLLGAPHELREVAGARRSALHHARPRKQETHNDDRHA